MQKTMSDVGESLPFDPNSHFELQSTDGSNISSTLKAVKIMLITMY